MCGFVGMFNKDGITEDSRQTLTYMSGAIRHRGPDEDDISEMGNLALAFRRLSIIDLEKGSQPFTLLDRYLGVFNGEIYNYLELREELVSQGYEFSTNSEIEVMLTLYHCEGESFVKKLRGMFAIAFYDSLEKKLFVARDPFGIKPMHYKENDGGIIFSSEMKAFLFDRSIDKFNVDTARLQHYCTYQYVPEPDTLTGQVMVLPAGNYFTYDAENGMKITEYVKNTFAPNKERYDDKLKKVREVIESSVQYHLLSDVPVGTFLSSGIDSAIVTAVASKLSPGIKAFTVAFNEKEYSELDDAAAIARHLDVEHIKLQGSVQDYMDAVESVVYHLDSPVADPSTVAIYIISREVAKHVKVVLSGEGADEFFGGYTIYKSGIASQRFFALPSFMRGALAALARVLPDGVRGKALLIRGTTPLEKRYCGNAFVFDEPQKRDLLKTFDQNQHFSDLTADIFREARGLPFSTQMQYCDINTWLRGDILVKGDRLSMAHSLELRVPFLDREVFGVARTLRDQDKYRKGTTKYILRDAFRDIVNPETFMRPKLGYPVPVRKWLKNEMYDWARDIINGSGADEYINKAEALRLLEDHKAGRADNYRPLWVILVFMIWHRLYIEDAENTRRRIISGEI